MTSTAPARPRIASLSLVVTVVDGGETLSRCLAGVEASLARVDRPCQVLVPYDDSVAALAALADRFPFAAFLPLGAVPTTRALPSEAARHELYDRRRAAGLAAATGDVIAMLEDRGVPRADHLARIVELHETIPHRVIGGAVDNAVARRWNEALFLCDFGRYAPPFPEHAADAVSDVCVSYARDALHAVRESWRERYVETLVHAALRARGETLWLTDRFTVDQRRANLRLGPLLAERFHWARLYAATRVRGRSIVRSFLYALATPLLPPLLLARTRRHARRARRPFPWITLVPHLSLLLVSWSAGEAAGYLTRRS